MLKFLRISREAFFLTVSVNLFFAQEITLSSCVLGNMLLKYTLSQNAFFFSVKERKLHLYVVPHIKREKEREKIF